MRYIILTVLFLFSLPAYADTIYMKSPQAPGIDFAAFKADYEALTGETIQDPPPENKLGTHYIIGSSRLTQEQADILVLDHPGITFSVTMPVGWEWPEFGE